MKLTKEQEDQIDTEIVEQGYSDIGTKGKLALKKWGRSKVQNVVTGEKMTRNEYLRTSFRAKKTWKDKIEKKLSTD